MVADTCVEQWVNPILNTFDYRQHIFYFLVLRVPKGIKLLLSYVSFIAVLFNFHPKSMIFRVLPFWI